MFFSEVDFFFIYTPIDTGNFVVEGNFWSDIVIVKDKTGWLF